MKKIIACSIGNCVHVAGAVNFLSLANKEGYETKFLGAALKVDDLLEAIKEEKPDIVGVSFRLTAKPFESILRELKLKTEHLNIKNINWIFGGTELTSDVARSSGFFSEVFDGVDDLDTVIAFLKGRNISEVKQYSQDLISQIKSKYPYPILRHHLGLPDLKDTVEAIKEIADAGVLDVISIAPDQNAQEYFFEQEEMDHRLDGAGGVAVRSKEDFRAIYEASQRGNYPLLRCYSGTKNLIPFAEMLIETIKNTWCAVPLCWYNVLDKRGPRAIRDSISENQMVMKWHGDKGVPVEVNESHHWSLRDAHDAVGVATAFLAAYNAKKMGVKDYISQLMFNVPALISPEKDLAKMLAKTEMIDSLQDENFNVYRQARAGLASLPTDLDSAKGQLAASTYLSMAIKPHIYHVVGYCEAHHAATAKDIIESCKIVKGVIKNTLLGSVDMAKNEQVQYRKNELIEEATIILDSIKCLNTKTSDPLTDANTIALAIEKGILDAPHLKGNPAACGRLVTQMHKGAMYAYDPEQKRILNERDRISRLLSVETNKEVSA